MVRIGIRREDKNEWERRVPLTPDHVAELVETHALEISVQPSRNRAFADRDYRAAGACIDDVLADCGLVFGIKEIPTDQLVPRRTYIFFSHTTKAQAENMPMLHRLLDLGATLIDYEQIRDEHDRRLISFGRFAGYAGMIDALWALGRRLEIEGFATPFSRVRLAHDYSNLDEATNHIARIGEELRHNGVPDGLRPIVCAFTGSGNVTRGAQEIFDRLPHVELAPEELERLPRDPERPRNVLYRVNFTREQRFEGLERWLPQLTMLVHGAFWTPEQPRLLSIEMLRRHWASEARPKLRVIADISCDLRGGIEASVRATTPGCPVFVYDLGSDTAVDGVRGDGPVVLAIDNLPCQIPVESSEHFGDTLVRFVPLLARCDWTRPFEQLELPREIADAVISHRGSLTPRFAYLNSQLK